MGVSKKQSKLNEADKALNSFLNELVLDPLDKKLTNYTPTLKKELNTSIKEKLDDIIGKFEDENDTITKILIWLKENSPEDYATLTKLEVVETNLNTKIDGKIKSIKNVLIPESGEITNDLYTEMGLLKSDIDNLKTEVINSKEMVDSIKSEQKNRILFFIGILLLQASTLFYMVKFIQ